MRIIFLLSVNLFLLFTFSSRVYRLVSIWSLEGRQSFSLQKRPSLQLLPAEILHMQSHVHKATNIQRKCNVCFHTAELLANQKTQQVLLEVAKLESGVIMKRSSKLIVMKIMEWYKCKSPDTNHKDFQTIWQDQLKGNYIANISVGNERISFTKYVSDSFFKPVKRISKIVERQGE